MQQAEIYISYAWGRDKTVASQRRQKVFDEVHQLLKRRNHRVIVDHEGIEYKKSISDFMRTLSKAKYIVLILSDRYLKSESCMFEATEIFRNGEFRERIFPIVLPDAKIHTARGRQKYLDYWAGKKQEIADMFDNLQNKELAPSHYEKLKQYDDIIRGLDAVVSNIGDMNTLNLDALKKSKYKELLDAIDNRIFEEEAWVVNDEDAFALLQVTNTTTPSQVEINYQLLRTEAENGIQTAKLPDVKEGYVSATLRLDAAYRLALPLAKKYLRNQKAKIRRYLNAGKYAEAKILLERLIKAEPNDDTLVVWFETCIEGISNQEYGQVKTFGKKVRKAKTKAAETTEENQETESGRTTRRLSNKSSDTSRKVVSSKKMRKKMQMQGKNTEKRVYRRIIVPAALAVVAIVLGFIMKERVLEHHVNDVIFKAREHVARGELRTALTLLEDESRDLVYEDRLAEELENFRILKAQTDELLLKIKSYKKQKKWNRAKRAIERLLVFTPKDSFLVYEVRAVERELKKNDVKFWTIAATEAAKEGESGYLRAKEAFQKARTYGINVKVIDANLEKLESMINLAFDRHVSKADIFSKADGGLAKAITEYEAALKLKPDDASVKRKLRDCKARL